MKKENSKSKTIIILSIIFSILCIAVIYAAIAPNPGHTGSQIKVDCPDGSNNIDLETCLQNMNTPSANTISCPIGGVMSVETCINNLNTQLQNKISNIEVKQFCVGYSCSTYGYTSGGSIDNEGNHACWNPSTNQMNSVGNEDGELCYKVIN